MPNGQLLSYLRIRDSDDWTEFLRNARIAWKKAHAPRKSTTKGRPSDELKIKTAIKKIEQEDCAFGPHWTLAEWLGKVRDKIDYSHADTTKGRATIRKYVKQWLARGVVITSHIPISIIKKRSIDEQLHDHFDYAIAQACVVSVPNGGTISMRFDEVNKAHRDLCSMHIAQTVRPTESKRARWFLHRWEAMKTANKVNPLKVESQKPRSPRPAS